MITIHHLNASRSFRVVWLVEELQFPYDLVCHQRGPDLRAQDDLRAVHPLGHAPIMVDDHTMMFESGAIVEYIIHRHGRGRLAVPCHHVDYPHYLLWLHAAEGTAMPALLPVFRAVVAGGQADQALRDANEVVLRLCDDVLGERDYFGCGEFTAADIMMHFYLHLAARFAPVSYARYPRLPPYLARLQARDGYQRALAVTGGMDLPAAEG